MLLIAPYRGFADKFVDIFHEHNLVGQKIDKETEQYKLEVVIASTLSDLENLDFDAEVVISRGFVSEDLRRMESFIPVVEIPIAAGDLVHCLQGVRTNFKERKVAVLGARNMVMGAEGFEEVFGLEIGRFVIDSTDGIKQAVENILGLGYEVVLGGVKTCEYAEALGLKSAFIESGKESIWHSITEAKRLAYVIRREEEKAENFKTVLNQSLEGIIALDRNSRIQVFNQAAERLLGFASKEAMGRTMGEVLPGLDAGKPAEDGAPEIVRHGGRTLSVTGTGMTLRGEAIGRIFTLQETARIQELEGRIREKIHARGHVAKHVFGDIIGESARIQEVILTAKKYSRVDSSVLITGTTGTGKEIFAQSIHNESPRRKGPFVAVNCAALPETLLESELFGYAEGAFTGAAKGGKAGLFELAHRGTLFLDEISEIPSRLQGRLLRAIQEKEIMRLGHDRVIPVDVRIVAASNRDLAGLVSSGSFREDLFYRLDILKLELPNLSERREDIPAIAGHWIDFFGTQVHGRSLPATEGAKLLLRDAPWPGNLRQLRNVCERLVVLDQDGVIDTADVEAVLHVSASRTESCEDREDPSFRSDLRTYERERILNALRRSNHSRNEAAALLGMSRTTLWRKLKDLGLSSAAGPLP